MLRMLASDSEKEGVKEKQDSDMRSMNKVGEEAEVKGERKIGFHTVIVPLFAGTENNKKEKKRLIKRLLKKMLTLKESLPNIRL